MAFQIIDEFLNGVKLIKSDVYADERGVFFEFYRADKFEELGLPTNFLQDNISVSRKNVLRGLHFQWDKPMGKYIRVSKGSAKFIEVDLRPNSTSFGKHIAVELSEENGLSLWTPEGFANGFVAQSEIAEINYKCTAIYNPQCEGSLLWSDKDLNINWNCENPILSDKDANAKHWEYWRERDELKQFIKL